jgi:hypothetical protein
MLGPEVTMSDAGRHVVAVVRLATPAEEEAKALAADLGTVVAEERLKLAGGMPAIVLSTADDEGARQLLEKLLARGHRALACRVADVAHEEDMVSLRQLALTADGLKSGAAELPWDDVSALVVARKKRTTETKRTVTEKKFDVGRSLLSGGLINRRTEKREEVLTAEESEQVLFVFRASGEKPWILRERGTNYAALGAALSPVASANFAAAVRLLRDRAPHARFDDSLLRRRGIDVDLYAHVLAHA